MPVLLEPAALLWRLATWIRWRTARPYRSKLPVVCIGNVTAGGSGKTPAAIAIAKLLKAIGETPVFVSRGYGGTRPGPHLVDLQKDSARDVGDEPLLLARTAPTIVGTDRAAGARLAETLEASVIVMDDGFQNPGLAKDFSLLVVDRMTGIGNGLVIPAGPLRAPVARQLAHAQALVLVGRGGGGDDVAMRAAAARLPVLGADVEPANNARWLKGKNVVAFAGIAHPDKFFQTLEQAGALVAERFSFPDHHRFTQKDAAHLLAAAAKTKAALVTTEKDHVRLAGPGDAIEALRKQARAVPVALGFHDGATLRDLLKKALAARRAN